MMTTMMMTRSQSRSRISSGSTSPKTDGASSPSDDQSSVSPIVLFQKLALVAQQTDAAENMVGDEASSSSSSATATAAVKAKKEKVAAAAKA